MSEQDFALELLRINQLDFVDQCIAGASNHFIFINLSPRLVAMLPEKERELVVKREDFSVENVIQEYEKLVNRVVESAQVAQEMLQSAKQQGK